MRSKGYAFDRKITNAGNKEELSFVRRITGREFPRFHAYVKLETDSQKKELIISLHLDQKRPTYEGGAAHGGEYESELIRQELARLGETN